jgi:hypothetical protein
VNTRNKIASTIASDDFESHNDRAGWQLALDYYSHLWRADYKQIKTKEDLVDSIRSSPRHHLSTLDLSLISRAYKIKFIVIAKPNRINKSGVVCLNTTQTQGDDIIVLYLQGLSDFSIVKNTSTSPERAVFKLAELPPFLQKEWVTSCVRDNLPTIDPSNQLYRMAPLHTKSVTGRSVFVDAETGRTVANPTVKQITAKIVPKITIKPKEKEPAPLNPAVEHPGAIQAPDQKKEQAEEFDPTRMSPASIQTVQAPAAAAPAPVQVKEQAPAPTAALQPTQQTKIPAKITLRLKPKK